MKRRVVITGLGVVSPNATGIEAFRQSLMSGQSGIRFFPELETSGFKCCIGGMPDLTAEYMNSFINQYKLTKLKSTGVLYGCMAGIEAWHDAGLNYAGAEPLWDSGAIFGTGCSGVEAIDYAIKEVDQGQVRKLGGRTAQQAMNSGVSAYLSGILGLGNQVTTNSSVFNTGTEAIIMAYDRIMSGQAERMIAGSTESSSPYIWAMLGAIYPLTHTNNQTPHHAMAPMSSNASGSVPGAGAGALVLESLDAALARKAKIYAEVMGASLNSGGHKIENSMIRSSGEGMVRCIREAISSAGIVPGEIDLISGNLASDSRDVVEVRAWAEALGRSGSNFPYINATKSMIGTCLSAGGSIETVATVLQLTHDFIHPTLNAHQLHPEIEQITGRSHIPTKTLKNTDIKIAAKLNTGYADVNSCLILKKWSYRISRSFFMNNNYRSQFII